MLTCKRCGDYLFIHLLGINHTQNINSSVFFLHGIRIFMVAENYKIFSTKIVFFLLLTFYDARTPFPCVQQNVHLFYTVCKAHYINCVLKELDFNSTCGDPSYNHSAFPSRNDFKIINRIWISLIFQINKMNLIYRI